MRPDISEVTIAKLQMATQEILEQTQVPISQLPTETQLEILLEGWADEKKDHDYRYDAPWENLKTQEVHEADEQLKEIVSETDLMRGTF